MRSLNIPFKNDDYKKNRGGYSRLLDISCEKCGNHVCYYQKDGPGDLKRMYLDRISGLEELNSREFTCPHCGEVLGLWIIYQEEDRPAYRLYAGAVIKKIVAH